MKSTASRRLTLIAWVVLIASCSSSPAIHEHAGDAGNQPDGVMGPGDASDASHPGDGPPGSEGGPPESCSPGQFSVTTVDYFTGAPVVATATVDGAPATTFPCLTLATGVHPIAVSAEGYPTYNDAIQVPGGATSRTVKLISITPSLASWLTLVNSDRKANGADPLALDNGLMVAAWDHAVDLGVQGYTAHFDPHGFGPTTRSLMLGSMVISAENLAFGQATYTAAEAAFMAERLMLPHQEPSDCATSYDLADHYCDLITTSHNLLGLAITDVPGSPYKTYYDQEFGDLYAYYDTTVLGPEPALGSNAPVTLIPAAGDTFTYEYVQTMPAPTPIPIATLDADPDCASMCPPGDLSYPTGNTKVSTSGPTPYSPTLNASEIVFLEMTTSATSFFGASVYAAFWGGGTVMPDTYGASASMYRVP